MEEAFNIVAYEINRKLSKKVKGEVRVFYDDDTLHVWITDDFQLTHRFYINNFKTEVLTDKVVVITITNRVIKYFTKQIHSTYFK